MDYLKEITIGQKHFKTEGLCEYVDSDGKVRLGVVNSIFDKGGGDVHLNVNYTNPATRKLETIWVDSNRATPVNHNE
jgi:hypothetical protein